MNAHLQLVRTYDFADQVSELPPGAELLASSEQTGIEMYSVGEHTLAIQGHPEFLDDVVDDLLEGRLKAFMTVKNPIFSTPSGFWSCG
jgi:GMP synthase-like glutamine amidotransferase